LKQNFQAQPGDFLLAGEEKPVKLLKIIYEGNSV
jgi:hypothetical protein